MTDSLIEKINLLSGPNSYVDRSEVIDVIRQYLSDPATVEMVAMAMSDRDPPMPGERKLSWEECNEGHREYCRADAKAALLVIMGDASTRKDEEKKDLDL